MNPYEGHVLVVNTLRDKVLTTAGMGFQPGQPQAVKDFTTAYVMAVDKLLTFTQTMVVSDGERLATHPDALRAIQKAMGQAPSP